MPSARREGHAWAAHRVDVCACIIGCIVAPPVRSRVFIESYHMAEHSVKRAVYRTPLQPIGRKVALLISAVHATAGSDGALPVDVANAPARAARCAGPELLTGTGIEREEAPRAG